MKKNYTKPEIMFEDFSMSTNIAAGCNKKIDNQSQGACAYLTLIGSTQYAIFTEDMTGVCTTSDAGDGESDGKYNGLCYHVPVDGKSLFNS